METTMFIQSFLEFVAVGFVIWGFINEDKLIAFENKIAANYRRRKLYMYK